MSDAVEVPDPQCDEKRDFELWGREFVGGRLKSMFGRVVAFFREEAARDGFFLAWGGGLTYHCFVFDPVDSDG
jgi:hypothetical protein